MRLKRDAFLHFNYKSIHVCFCSQISTTALCMYSTFYLGQSHRTILYRKEVRFKTKRARELCFDFPFGRRGLRDSRSKRCDATATWVSRECLVDNNGYCRVFFNEISYILRDSKLLAALVSFYIQKWANTIISRNNSNQESLKPRRPKRNQNKVLSLVLFWNGLPFHIV